MHGKPFRSPLIKARQPAIDGAPRDGEPVAKRPCPSIREASSQDVSGPRLVFKTPGVSSLPRKPLAAVENLAGTIGKESRPENCTETYYNVLWYGLHLLDCRNCHSD